MYMISLVSQSCDSENTLFTLQVLSCCDAQPSFDEAADFQMHHKSQDWPHVMLSSVFCSVMHVQREELPNNALRGA